MLPWDLRQIALVVTMARLRSQKAAAEALNVSQTSASRRLAALERQLGVDLFRRGWNGAELTHAGEALARDFMLILEALEAAQSRLFPDRTTAPDLWASLRYRDLMAVRATVANARVSAAATALGRTQPEISRSISQVEDHLGLRLFRRRRSGMEPLDGARDLSALADEIDAFYGRALRTLSETEGQVTGRIAIGMLPFSGQALVMRAFAQLTLRYPRLRLIAMPGSYASLVEALRRGEIDMLVGVGRGPGVAPDLTEERLYPERFTILASRDHPMARLSGDLGGLIGQLGRTSWVIAPPGTPIRTYFEHLFETSEVPPPAHSCEILSFSYAEQMLVESKSLGMLSYSRNALQSLRPDLKALDIDLPDPEVAICATQLVRAQTDLPVREFLSLLKILVAPEQ